MDRVTSEQREEAIEIAAKRGKLDAIKYLKTLYDEQGNDIFSLKEAKDYIESITDRFYRYIDEHSIFSIQDVTSFWEWWSTCDIDYENKEAFQSAFIKFFSISS